MAGAQAETARFQNKEIQEAIRAALIQSERMQDILEESGMLLVAAYQTLVVQVGRNTYYLAFDTDEFFSHNSFAKSPPARGEHWSEGVHFADGTHALQKYINSGRRVAEEVVEYLEEVKRDRARRIR